MKALIIGLAAVATIAALPRVPGDGPDHGPSPAAGLDPEAVECLVEQECKLISGLLRRGRDERPAHASISAISVRSGTRPFAGDRRLLTTVSPNGDGVRDRAAIRLTLTRPATVRLVIARTERRARAVYTETRRLPAGNHTFVWAPPETMPARSYLTYFDVRDRGGRSTYGRPNGDPRRRQRTPVIRILGVDAGFARESYRPTERAELRLSADAARLTLQFFRSGPERVETRRADELNGIAVSEPGTYDWRRRRNARQRLSVPLGSWPTGMYFAKLTTDDGRVGFAPFIVRPERLGAHRVAVVLPTNTWQAYNFRDSNGDGWGETWYVHQAHRTITLGRPQLFRGVPLAFSLCDLPFLHWLSWNERPVDYLAQRDLELASARKLRNAYDLVIFSGHHEYVTKREYDVVATFRNLGGNLMFLSANNFFWRVERRGNRLRRVALWRDLGRAEAALIGVQYVGNGRRTGPYTVIDTDAVPSLFAGLQVAKGSRFGRFGIEIDKTTPSSPAGTRVLAEIRNLFGRGLSAQMTYYETAAGAKVFAAGAFTLAGRATTPYGGRLLDNLWAHMTQE